MGPFQEIKDEINGKLGEEIISMYVCISETEKQKQEKGLKSNESESRNF